MLKEKFDIVIVGGGHAGVEAALACSRLGKKTLLLTLSLDAISFMACNPAIGGTAKGHLVREIDALGGQMGIAADANLLQIRMLNTAKGAAVHSLRGQADKIAYHNYMKRLLENTPNLKVMQGEAVEIVENNGAVCGVKTALGTLYECDAAVIATGVYLKGSIIIGDYTKNSGPSGFEAANYLTNSLIDLGFEIRRFKTGTPARVNRNSIDFSKMQIQNGDDDIYPFSFLTEGFVENKLPCYLTYTNEKTHDIIKKNISRSPLYNGSIKSVGPRYCPSIEDKVMRFADKERHQLFIEPESAFTEEMYVQGMSSSMPHDVQIQMYRSIEGLENVEIMRYAYAIEYDCIDSRQLLPSLMYKGVKGLFCAGQLNGTSGYEEAAAQGLIAGINSVCYLNGLKPLVLGRNEAYIGVLIDDLITKGTNEPYRMMTARAEYRLELRQENADLRLTPYAEELGLASPKRLEKFHTRKAEIERLLSLSKKSVAHSAANDLLEKIGEQPLSGGASYADLLKRPLVTAESFGCFADFKNANLRCLKEVETLIKYEGYLKKQQADIAEKKKLENKLLPENLDYNSMSGLRLEARQKLDKIRPQNLGQASRISGVSPADITVLMVYLERNKH